MNIHLKRALEVFWLAVSPRGGTDGVGCLLKPPSLPILQHLPSLPTSPSFAKAGMQQLPWQHGRPMELEPTVEMFGLQGGAVLEVFPHPLMPALGLIAP